MPRTLKSCLEGAVELTDELLAQIREEANPKIDCFVPINWDFVKTGKARLRCGDFALFRGHDNEIVSVGPNGHIYYDNDLGRGNLRDFKKQLRESSSYQRVDGLIIFRGKDIIVVNNGDLNDSVESNVLLEEFSTLSFRCVGRFFTSSTDPAKLSKVGAEALLKGKVLDFSYDQRIELTAKQKSGREKLLPPKPGFSFVHFPGHGYWHRSGSFLISYKGSTILLGMDEGAYFGCELPDNKAKTIEQAEVSLVPKQIRGKKCPRQGEWFAEKIKAPNRSDVIAIGADGMIALPIDKDGASLHHVNGKEVYVTREDGIVALDPVVYHENAEHQDLELKGWYRFHHNTAVRSFSEAGVD